MIAPPPNPHADAARAALREYGSALFKNAPAEQVVDEPEPQAEPQDELALARATWPAMRLLDSAAIGPGMWWCPECGMSHERAGAVVVTVKGLDAE